MSNRKFIAVKNDSEIGDSWEVWQRDESGNPRWILACFHDKLAATFAREHAKRLNAMGLKCGSI